MTKQLIVLLATLFPVLLLSQNAGLVVTAGGNRTITLPTNSLTISGADYTNNTGVSGTVYMGWSVLSTPPNAPQVSIANNTTKTPTFAGLIQGSYMLQFTVVVGSEYNNDIITVTVNPAPPHAPPVVTPGGPYTTTLPTNVVAISANFTIASGYSVLSKNWTAQGAGNTATINNANSENASVVLPTNITTTTNFVFRFTVVDNANSSSYADVIVTVIPESSSGGGNWTLNGNNQYNTNSGLIIVGGGTTMPSGIDATTKLAVKGNIYAEKITVKQNNWADFVFDPGYKLMPLPVLNKYVQQNRHLPGVPSTTDVTNKPVDVAKTQALLLQKIEELTLYMIEQDKKIEQQRKKLEAQQRQIKSLKRK
jgi:hypothetical protein